jgi:hypothetical protein
LLHDSKLQCEYIGYKIAGLSRNPQSRAVSRGVPSLLYRLLRASSIRRLRGPSSSQTQSLTAWVVGGLPSRCAIGNV